MVKTYTKKPISISAIQYLGYYINVAECLDFCGRDIGSVTDGDFFIETLEGKMEVSPGDYIICGVEGEFYPCKPSIFETSYREGDDKSININFEFMEKKPGSDYYSLQVFINIPKYDIEYGDRDEMINGIIEACEHHIRHLIK